MLIFGVYFSDKLNKRLYIYTTHYYSLSAIRTFHHKNLKLFMKIEKVTGKLYLPSQIFKDTMET